MMEFYVSGQSLKLYSPVIAADSLNYLSARVHFADDSWLGASKWLHFRRKGEGADIVYDMALDEKDAIEPSQGLYLSCGQWEVYLSGTREDTRLTTVPVILTVQESGLVDAPLHELPMTVAEQVDYNAKQALLLAQNLSKAAQNGDFDGKDGTSLSPIGHFDTAEELSTIVSNASPGDVYSVGLAAPYELYVWDGVGLRWRNHGFLQGVPGEKGEPGVNYLPYVDSAGNISWSNNAGLENPATRNIMGPAGKDGEAGSPGPGAFEKAQEAGYTGTQESFYAALTMMPYHNRRHQADGADPISVQSGNIEAGAVTREKLARDVKTLCFTDIIIPDYAWQPDDTLPLYPYRAAILLEGAGIDAGFEPCVSFAPNSTDLAPVAQSFESGVYVYAAYPPEELICVSTLSFAPAEAQPGEHPVFARIAVAYTVGKSLSCTDGQRISNAMSRSGRWEFAIPHAGDWLISDGELSRTVSISTPGQQESIELFPEETETEVSE